MVQDIHKAILAEAELLQDEVVGHVRRIAAFPEDTSLVAHDRQVQHPCCAYQDKLHGLGQTPGLEMRPE